MEDGTELCRSRMVPALKERGLWEYEPFRDDYGSETAVREKMHYFRHYRQYWRDMGWIGEGRRCPRPTPSGMAAVEMFFTDEEEMESREERTFSDPVENRNEIVG